MKHWILAACLICFGSSARAQDAAPAAPPAPLATVSGTAVESPVPVFAGDPVASALANQVVADLPSGAWNGRFDRNPDFHIGGWQSLKSLDQAYGISKPVWSLNKGDTQILVVGLFAGVKKPLDPLASSGVRFLAGETVVVPGHAFDWALGTKMGSYWLPKAKAGLLIAHDWSRPKALKLVPDFVGLGLTYGFGEPAAK